MIKHKILGIFIAIFMVTSCADKSETVVIHNINGKWNKKDIQKFDLKIADAQHPKNITFVVRNNNEYPYSNLRLIVNFLNVKSKKSTTDTLNYVLAEPNGAWIGKGFGDTKETLFQYKLNYKFPENGNYSMSISQAMRKDVLVGIEDIGIKIEKAKP